MGLLLRRGVKPPPTPDLLSGYVGAPIGGINTVDLAEAMPPKDAIYCWNMVPAEYGLRARLGYREWVTGLSGASGVNPVRTVIPFTGTAANGAADRLFVAGTDGDWDVSASTAAPGAAVITFGVTTGNAGYGISTVMTTPAGRFVMYCDEENGLFVYSENAGTWTQVVLGASVFWTASTSYFVGDTVANGANTYVVTIAGASAGSGGPTGTGTGITDGSVTWNYVAAYSAATIGPSLADQRNGFTGNPANFAAVCVWKNRVWLVEKSSTRAWYLGVNSVYGVATAFDFGSKMKAGGPLANLYNWSYDGGSGMDTLLVGVSTAGDVVIYQGTDPSSATTFGLKGCWGLGGVPAGRRIATDNGGDLLALSLVGIIPLSKLVTGKLAAVEDSRSVYETGKIANLFNVLAAAQRTSVGWAMHLHPTDNTLLVLVPTQPGQPTQQLAMSFATKGWGRYRDLPMLSSGVWNGQLYFGTTDGRVCINDGYLDNVLLSNPNTFSPVAWSVLTGYSDLDNARVKKVEVVSPRLLSDGGAANVAATALYDLNLTEPAPPSATGAAGAGGWDSGVWDAAVWGGDYSATIGFQGAQGVGRSIAIAARGNATARTVLAGFHVFYRQGGLL